MNKSSVIALITCVLILGLFLGWIISAEGPLAHDGVETFTAKDARADIISNWFAKNPKGVFSQFKQDLRGDIVEYELGRKHSGKSLSLVL